MSAGRECLAQFSRSCGVFFYLQGQKPETPAWGNALGIGQTQGLSAEGATYKVLKATPHLTWNSSSSGRSNGCLHGVR
jgi:hypothetical protein